MAAAFIKIYPENPDPRRIQQVVEVLKQGGVIIYPTDTIYGMGCDIFNQKAIERISLIKGVKPKKQNFSFICYDLSNISEYTRALSTPVFKMMKKALPGPFTFILDANNKVPKMLNSKKKTVGIRVPDHNIPRTLVKELGQPILTTSIRDEDDVIEYSTDPELIYEKFKDLVDVVIDGGYGNNVASTVVDCTADQIEVLREGLGEINEII
ncbi:tRNA threonylcarbamoyl adenosine modification protein, Sua5/YciO/YrdC/YwlC family [Cyclobacterium lianum]|uniref:tRNA threonylcarbamoyl adenosine modification protein, Sua5/YciO/YrdC/YwlC family n=1 Tax=Cyclobacterium lianum TaxID=388280 RepID=A0A1M7PXH9_9BACT|nr:L-threonylcarbamoyladenylate synthase [Cyclobacterium lianum]SHN22308.1 tRNA threonylcarbamoyl adenosine modification protein, Sua5/YciO/YrdC/YwlC family [Cyclobacterium lianum]